MSTLTEDYQTEVRMLQEAYRTLFQCDPHHPLLAFYNLETEMLQIPELIKELEVKVSAANQTQQLHIMSAYTRTLKRAIPLAVYRDHTDPSCNGKTVRSGKPSREPHE